MIRLYILFCMGMSMLLGVPKYYDDRLMVYIDNSVADFNVLDNKEFTSISELNDLMRDVDAITIEQWLPNARPTDKNRYVSLDRFYVIHFGVLKTNIDRLVHRFVSLDAISISEKVPIVEPAYVPNDSLWDQLYGLSQIKADLAFDLWDVEGGEIPGQMENGEIVVAIPDVGLRWSHPDLIGNIWQNLGEDLDGDGVVIELVDGVWAFDPDDENGIDDDGDGYVDNFVGYDVAMEDNDPWPLQLNHVHGTKVAGNVSAMTNNGIGLASVGYSVKLMGVNANENINGPSSLTHTNEAVLAAAQMGADIINCSWVSSGYSGFDSSFYQIINDEYGCIVLGAAGNGVNNGGISDTTDFNPRYPAAYDNVVSVTAMGDNDSFNCWSNVHETVDISAPGEFIICTYTYRDTLYALGTGTSYATPLTAGAIALVKSVIPEADNETILSKVFDTAEFYPDMLKNCGGQSIEGLVGSGQLNIHRAILACTYPELLLNEINYQTDDGFINPGDTIAIHVTIKNSIGFEPANNVVAILSSHDPNFIVISDQINGDGSPLFTGEELTGQFVFTSDHGASLGDIPFNIELTATSGDYSYDNHIEILVPVSLGILGFPIEDVSIDFPPTITDIDDNNYSEIYFSSDSIMYGKWMGGLNVNGFPFNAGSQISTASSVGDLDGDGYDEIVFGTTDGVVYTLDHQGTLEQIYYHEGDLLNVPVLSDLDQDGDMEIIFTSNLESEGTLYAIDHAGNNVIGFPFEVNNVINTCPSVADLDNDGVLEILISSRSWNDATGWEVHMLAIDGIGNLKTGFPFSIDARKSTPMTLIDLDNDQDVEIVHAVVPNNSQSGSRLWVWGHEGEGSSINFFDTEGSINGGVSVADIDDNGSMDLLFAGEDGYLYAWDPIANLEPDGWPIELGAPGISEPIVVDMDNDGDLEVMCVSSSNEVHFYHHTGTYYDNFPYISQDSIFSIPAVGDLDNDGDNEIIVGTLSDLRVIDIAQQSGHRYTWSSYRGNNHRDGYFDISFASTSLSEEITPSEYVLNDNYPNPFNPITRFSYSLPKNTEVKITIHDINGRIVRTLLNETQDVGNKLITWNARNETGVPVATGIYFYKIEAGDFRQTKKMVLLK